MLLQRSAQIPVVLAALLACVLAASAEARTRTFCVAEPWYGGRDVSCGGHLQAVCTSGAACDPGHNSYSGSPFPITIDCPTIDLPFPLGELDIDDETVSDGCYDRRPTCADCGGEGQPACPSVVEPVCAAGCDPGLAPHPTTTICELPGAPGSHCGPGFPCTAGLVCDPFEGFRCVQLAGPDESCANPFVKCAAGLQCTLALRCSHEPAREGETCDATAPCANGLFCQAGIPQRCQPYRKPGQGCSAFNPCIPGASCEACFTENCNAPLQCFWNANNGAITEQQCRTLYSGALAQAAIDGGLTMTYAAGDGIGAIIAESQSFGVVYGQNGEYGCFTSFCFGINSDVSIEAFTSVGFYTSFDAVGGASFVNTQEVQLPGDLLNFSTTQEYERFGTFPEELIIGDLIGTSDAFAIGGGLNPSPFTAGSLICETTLDELVRDGGGPPPSPPPPPPNNAIPNADFDSDLADWLCTNGGVCAWMEDDPQASTTSGSGQVTSPPSGSFSSFGRLESGCVAVEEGIAYEVAAWLKTTGAQSGQLFVLWSSNESCAGGVVGNDLFGITPPDNTWRHFAVLTTPPPGAIRARINAIAARDEDTGTAGVTRVDLAYIPEPSDVLSQLFAGATLLAVWAGRTGKRRRRDRIGTGGSISTRSALARALLLLAATALAPTARAAPVACPVVNAEARCAVIVGDTVVDVRASSLRGGYLEVFEWVIGGVPQLFGEAFLLRDLTVPEPVDATLQSATVDAATNTIAAQFLESSTGSIRATAVFAISDTGNASKIDETLTVESLLGTVFGRLYVVNDFDLGDDVTDSAVFSNANGSLLTQIDGDTTATVQVIAGPIPDAFQVSTCCGLDDLVDGATFPLSGATSAPGPADFESAQSWDRTLLQGQNFSVMLRKTITTPEPRSSLAAAAVCLVLVALARCGRSTRAADGAPPLV